MKNKNYIEKRRISELGKEFVKELEKVLEIRAQRNKIYGNLFLKEHRDSLLVMIKGKLFRYCASKDLENKKDSLKDMINYILFLLVILNKKGDKKK